MRAIIFANGSLGDPQFYQPLWRPDDLVLAADGGAHHALAAGLVPQVVIGDLDSLPANERHQLEARGCRFIAHPPRKDESDLELALSEAARQGAQEVWVLAAVDGRIDQMLANILLLTRPEFAALKLRLVGENWEALLVREEVEISGQVGDTVSLIPLSHQVSGIHTIGLDYPLRDGVLEFGSTLGISNSLTESMAQVHIASGLLLAVRLARRGSKSS